MDKKSPCQGDLSPEVDKLTKVKQRVRSAPTLSTPNTSRLLEEDEEGKVLPRSRSYESVLFGCSERSVSKSETRRDKSILFFLQEHFPGALGGISPRVSQIDSQQTDPVSYDSKNFEENGPIESEGVSLKPEDTNLDTDQTETSSEHAEYAPSDRSGSNLSCDLSTLPELQPEAAQQPQQSSHDDVVSQAHQGSPGRIEELQRVCQGAIPRRSLKKPCVAPLAALASLALEKYSAGPGQMEPRHDSSPTTSSWRYRPVSDICRGDNRPVFLDVLRTNTDVIILTKKKNGEVTVFVLIPNPLKPDFINVYLLDGRVMKPLVSTYAAPPYDAHCLSGLMEELHSFLPRENFLLSEWAVIDREMAAASTQILMQHPEIVPASLFGLLATRFFANADSMMYFFEHDYGAYREERLALARQEPDRELLGRAETAKIKGQTSTVLRAPLREEQTPRQQQQTKYVETLKPRINIPPLPPRPHREPALRKPPGDEIKQFATQPPSPAELAALQARYERDGRPRIRSQPRQPETSEDEEEKKNIK